MKRKITFFVLVAVMLLLSACGNKPAESTASPEPTHPAGSGTEESTPAPEETAPEIPEGKQWVPDASGKYVDGEILYDYSLSLNSSHSPDMYVKNFKPANTVWDVEINFPTHDHNVKACDAYSSMGFYLTAHTFVDKFNNRTDFVLEAFGDEFYDLVCPHGTNIKNSFAGEYIELLMQKLGKPSGVIEKVRAEFFNNYQWFMYWERDGYVICIKVDESESGDNWSSRFFEPILITDSAWEFVKEETLTNDEEYQFKDIRF